MKEQKLPGTLWDLLATIKQTQEDRSCACSYAFLLGFCGLFGWVHLGTVHRYLTANSCRSADAVRAHRKNAFLGVSGSLRRRWPRIPVFQSDGANRGDLFWLL